MASTSKTEEKTGPSATSDGEGGDSKPRRINVAVTPEAIAAIENVIERDNVTLTEAVRRLLHYGAFVYEAVKVQGDELVLHTSNGTTKDVVFV